MSMSMGEPKVWCECVGLYLVPSACKNCEPAAADEATLTPVKAGQASQQGGEGDDAPALSADTQSTAARKDVPGQLRMTPASDPQPEPQDRIGGLGNDPEVAILAAGTQAPPVDTHSEPGNGLTGEKPVVAPRQAGEASSDASPVRRMTMTPLEPRTAGGLKGFGFTVKFDDVHEPVQPVKEGSTTIPHHGTVRA